MNRTLNKEKHPSVARRVACVGDAVLSVGGNKTTASTHQVRQQRVSGGGHGAPEFVASVRGRRRGSCSGGGRCVGGGDCFDERCNLGGHLALEHLPAALHGGELGGVAIGGLVLHQLHGDALHRGLRRAIQRRRRDDDVAASVAAKGGVEAGSASDRCVETPAVGGGVAVTTRGLPAGGGGGAVGPDVRARAHVIVFVVQPDVFELSTRARPVRLLVVPREAPRGATRVGVVVDREGKRVPSPLRDGTDPTQDAARALRGLHRRAGLVVLLSQREILFHRGRIWDRRAKGGETR